MGVVVHRGVDARARETAARANGWMDGRMGRLIDT